METNKEDKLIREFMSQQKTEPADNFFTEKVMHKLPEKQKNYEWIIVLLAAIGTIISLVLGWNSGIPAIRITLPGEIKLYYLLGGIFVSPFVLWSCFEFLRRKNIHWL
ncbi:MAG: DUF5056 domain-containing protein [Paludibacter sp.]|nr:DUF5056 domain-containing protein [Paludibacter sp.]